MTSCWSALEVEKGKISTPGRSLEEITPYRSATHMRFGHRSATRTIMLLQAAGVNDSQLFAQVRTLVKACKVCPKYSKPKKRSFEQFPSDSSLQQHAGLRLFFFESQPILSTLCLGTRLMQSDTLYPKNLITWQLFSIAGGSVILGFPC